MKPFVLGVLAVVLLAPHAFADHRVISTVYELHAFTDMDGKRIVSENIAKTFPSLQSCIEFAMSLPAPPPAETTHGGHTIIKGYTCIGVTAPGMETRND